MRDEAIGKIGGEAAMSQLISGSLKAGEEMTRDTEAMTDYEVVQSVLKGNKDDFEEIIKRYKNLVFAVIHRMTNDYDEANDTAQDVFIKIYKNLDKYNSEYKFATWVIKITTNHIIDLRRRKKQDTVPMDEVEFGLSGGSSPEDKYVKEESSRELFRLIEELPEIYRTPLLLYHREGLSYLEIAEKTNESMSKVKNRIFRGRKLLRESLSKEGIGNGLL
ncbi:MAG: sigma-70 family RNA polymerase sigma factor [Clostridiales bacterium]|nr:sigma-70 family RNA polymerase sigma factor [Clostridiales bacterium]